MKKPLAIVLAVVVGLLSVTATAFADKAVSIWLRDIITFGQYPQTAKGNDKTPIEWIVLEIQDGKALLISKYGLDCQPYHKSKKNITWEKCSLRTWLNKDFLKKAFSKEEQSAILTTEVNNGSKQKPTKDQIFLLSRTEAEAYFHATRESYNNTSSRVAPTAYAISKRKAYTDSFDQTSDRTPAGWWWLRSSGSNPKNAATIRTNGGVYEDSVNYKTLVVRPALWVDLNNEVFSEYIYDTGDAAFQASFQSWLDEGAGNRLPKPQLQSGEEPEIELIVNDEQSCDIRVFNARTEDYEAYVSLLKSCGCRIVWEGELSVEARSPEGYEVYVSYSEGPERFLEVFIIAPNGL